MVKRNIDNSDKMPQAQPELKKVCLTPFYSCDFRSVAFGSSVWIVEEQCERTKPEEHLGGFEMRRDIRWNLKLIRDAVFG